MVYDIDDWEYAHHQRAHILGPIQIDEMCEYETRAKSTYSIDIDYDFEYWEGRLSGTRKNGFRFLSDEVREAKRTIASFPKRVFVNKESKNYKMEFAKYNRALDLVRRFEEEEDDREA